MFYHDLSNEFRNEEREKFDELKAGTIRQCVFEVIMEVMTVILLVQEGNGTENEKQYVKVLLIASTVFTAIRFLFAAVA